MFEVVFEGKTQPGFDVAQVKANLKALFKASDEQVQRMFVADRSVVLRNGLDEATARKYERALSKAGACVDIRDSQTGAALASPQCKPEPPSEAEPHTAAASVPDSPVSAGGEEDSRIEAILSDVDWSLAPVGALMAEEGAVIPESPLMVDQALDWGLAPVGSDMGQLRQDRPPLSPDISHLDLLPSSD